MILSSKPSILPFFLVVRRYSHAKLCGDGWGGFICSKVSLYRETIPCGVQGRTTDLASSTLGTRGFFLANVGRNRPEAEPRPPKADATSGLPRERTRVTVSCNRKPRKKSLWHPGYASSWSWDRNSYVYELMTTLPRPHWMYAPTFNVDCRYSRVISHNVNRWALIASTARLGDTEYVDVSSAVSLQQNSTIFLPYNAWWGPTSRCASQCYIATKFGVFTGRNPHNPGRNCKEMVKYMVTLKYCGEHTKDVHTFHNFTEDLFLRITPACTHRPHNS